MTRYRFATIGIVFLVFGTAVVASDLTWNSEFGNTLYNTPKGWATTQKGGAVMLIPPDLKPGEDAAIVITPGGELKGDFKQALTDFRAALRGNAKGREGETQAVNADEGYPILLVAEQVEDANGAVKQYRYFCASHPGNRVEFVFLVTNTRDTFDRYTKDFSEFIKTLAYKNARPGAHVTTAPATK